MNESPFIDRRSEEYFQIEGRKSEGKKKKPNSIGSERSSAQTKRKRYRFIPKKKIWELPVANGEIEVFQRKRRMTHSVTRWTEGINKFADTIRWKRNERNRGIQIPKEENFWKSRDQLIRGRAEEFNKERMTDRMRDRWNRYQTNGWVHTADGDNGRLMEETGKRIRTDQDGWKNHLGEHMVRINIWKSPKMNRISEDKKKTEV